MKFAAFNLVMFFCTMVVAPCVANAEDGGTDDSVVISSKRVPIGAFPYSKLYEVAKQFSSATKGRAALSVLMSAARDGVSLVDLSVTLSDSSEDIPVPLREHLLMRVPVVDRMAEHGELVVNKPKGSIKGEIVTVPAVDDSEWTIGLVKAVIRDYNDALPTLKPIVPWYARPFMHGIRSVSFCAKSPGSTIELSDKGAFLASFSANESAKDDLMQNVFCYSFSANASYPDSAHIRFGHEIEVVFQ